MYKILANICSSEPIPLYIQKYLGKPDARVKNWIFLNSPLSVLGIYFLYGAIVLGGKYLMKNRRPLALNNALVIYNTIQIAFSAYICKEIVVSAYLGGYKLSCTPLDTSNNKVALRMATAFWYFYVSKLVDLIDTIFFVFRKKNSQLTFLHIYHHTSMITNWYLGVLYVPGGQAFFSASINAFVHVIMYTYYLMSAVGPKMQKYLWWKKYLTQIQLIQFVMVMIHMIFGYMNGCNKPRWLIYFTITYLWTLVILFANFYSHAYKKRFKTSKLYNKPVLGMESLNSNIDIKAGGDMKID